MHGIANSCEIMYQENTAVTQRPVFLATMFPRHFEHHLIFVKPLQARDTAVLKHVLQPRPQQDPVPAVEARPIHPGMKTHIMN